MAAGRIIRICLFTETHENILIEVRINDEDRHTMSKGNTTTAAENVLIDFSLGDTMQLRVFGTRERIQSSDHIILLLELDL